MTMDERVQHEPEQRGEPSLRDPASVVQFGELSGEEELRGVRHRRHQFPGRSRAVKVLYDETEFAGVRTAALAAGLTPTGFVAAAGLTLADPNAGGRLIGSGDDLDRAVLTELLAIRTALRRYGVNVNQGIAALHSGVGAPVWLRQAVAGCDRAVGRLDDVTLLLSRRLR
jgi:hypothetical protein